MYPESKKLCSQACPVSGAGAGLVSSLAGLGGPVRASLGHTRKGHSEDPSLRWFQASPQGRQPRQAELQMLQGYFILFYFA